MRDVEAELERFDEEDSTEAFPSNWQIFSVSSAGVALEMVVLISKEELMHLSRVCFLL